MPLLPESYPIVHAFETFRLADQPADAREGRCMLSLETNERLLPATNDVQRIVLTWVQHWFQTAFQTSDLGGIARQVELLNRLSDVILAYEPRWYQREVQDFWVQRRDGRRYQAIPSVLAALLHNKISVIDALPVTWRLAIDRATNRFIVVSDPLLSEYPLEDEDGQIHWVQGTFAYKIRFALHTFAGTNEQWVHAFLSCTRYIDQTVTKMNWGHAMTIQVRTSKARKEGWPVAQTLVPLSAITYAGVNEVRWNDYLSDLLERLEVRTFVEPKELLARPLFYRTPSAATNWDQFLLVHAEGIHPAHAVKTGFGCYERMETIQRSILHHLGEILLPGDPLKRDKGTSMVRKAAPLMTWEELREFVPREQLAAFIRQALQRALRGKRLTLLICWYTPRTIEAIRKQLRRLLFLADDDPWPEEITVIEREIPDELVGPLDCGDLDPNDFYNKARPADFFIRWYRQMRHARGQRLYTWEKQIWSQLSVEPGSSKLVLMEVPRPSKKFQVSQWPKGTLRRAALIGWQAGHQVLHPMNPRYDEEHHPLEENTRSSQGRAKNALADLLFRQTGLLFDLPRTIYSQQAKLPTRLADDLVVIGLYHKRANKTKDHPRIDLPLAIRLLPSGLVEMSLPGEKGNKQAWQPYLDGTITELAPRFASTKGLLYSPAENLTFLRDILQENTNRPTLILVRASDWRSRVWPQLRNDWLQDPHVLDVNNPNLAGLPCLLPMTPETDPNVRVVRLREQGTIGETPQYLATIEEVSWDQVQEAKELRSSFGCIDTSMKGPFFHYLSLGQQPKTAHKQDSYAYKHAQGGAIAFKYQVPLEIVPIFLQQSDEPLHWARIPHFLRRSPAWDGGSLVLPYPLHLAQTAVEDCMALFGEVQQEEEDDDG